MVHAPIREELIEKRDGRECEWPEGVLSLREAAGREVTMLWWVIQPWVRLRRVTVRSPEMAEATERM